MVARDPNISVSMTAEEYAKHQATPKYMTGGEKAAAYTTAGTNFALTGIQALMTQAHINKLKKQMALSRAKLDQPVLTGKALATAKSMEDAVVRQGKADTARGTVGGSGMDQDRMERVQKAALLKGAQVLSGETAAEMARRKGLVEQAKADQSAMLGLQVQRDADLMGGIKETVQDEDLAGLFGRAGEGGRKKLTGELGEQTKLAEENLKKAKLVPTVPPVPTVPKR
jgi:hypothetical protein